MISDLKIAFGSQTGNAKNLAYTIGEQLENRGLLNEVIDMSSMEPEDLHHTRYLLIVTSTYGDGEAPENASEWLSFLKFNDHLNLNHLSFAVLGLGDTYYPHFCGCARDFDHYLEKHGASRLTPRLDCDLYYEEQYGEWLEEFTHSLTNIMKERDE
jgi:sulfite reductase (NADPH) flavoprotein alpha-component